jgi:hypothetical protein
MSALFGLWLGVSKPAFALPECPQRGESSARYADRQHPGYDHGLLVGISSGANVWAARQLAKKISGNIATMLPDRAERYFSTALM